MTHFDKAFNVFGINLHEIESQGYDIDETFNLIADDYCCHNTDTFLINKYGASCYNLSVEEKKIQCERIKRGLPQECMKCWEEDIPDD